MPTAIVAHVLAVFMTIAWGGGNYTHGSGAAFQHNPNIQEVWTTGELQTGGK